MAGILIPAMVWAGMHSQYDLYDLSVIFVMGLILGEQPDLERIRCCLTIGLHALFNGLSTLEVAIYTA